VVDLSSRKEDFEHKHSLGNQKHWKEQEGKKAAVVETTLYLDEAFVASILPFTTPPVFYSTRHHRRPFLAIHLG